MARTQLSPRNCCTSSVSLVGCAVYLELDLERVVNFWQFAGCGEIDVHDGADDLDDCAVVTHYIIIPGCLKWVYPSAICAVVISSNCVVIAAWRILLYSRVRSLMSCFALSVAFFMATMRALCSEARESSSIW